MSPFDLLCKLLDVLFIGIMNLVSLMFFAILVSLIVWMEPILGYAVGLAIAYQFVLPLLPRGSRWARTEQRRG